MGRVKGAACPHTTVTDETVMSRGVVGGRVALFPPLAVTPRLVINPVLERDRNGGSAWLARVVVQHLHTRPSYRRIIPAQSI
jgi:hypothetical protein